MGIKMDKRFDDLLQKASRHHMHAIWQAAKNNAFDGMDDDEVQIANIMMEHKDQYYNEFEFADVLDDYKFDPESGETNPFLHIVFHGIIENQLRDKDPIETYQFFNAMRNKRANRHDAIHMLGSIFVYFLFPALKNLVPFDEDEYRRVLKILTIKKPEAVWAALDKGLDRFLDQ
jgi:hypothetical protein